MAGYICSTASISSFQPVGGTVFSVNSSVKKILNWHQAAEAATNASWSESSDS